MGVDPPNPPTLATPLSTFHNVDWSNFIQIKTRRFYSGPGLSNYTCDLERSKVKVEDIAKITKY